MLSDLPFASDVACFTMWLQAKAGTDANVRPPPLLNANSKSLTTYMKAWFEQFSVGAAWNVYSDYCVLDQNKANDSVSFVIILH